MKTWTLPALALASLSLVGCGGMPTQDNPRPAWVQALNGGASQGNARTQAQLDANRQAAKDAAPVTCDTSVYSVTPDTANATTVCSKAPY